MSTFNNWLKNKQTCRVGVILADLPPCCTFRAEPSGGGGTSAHTKSLMGRPAWWQKATETPDKQASVSAVTRRLRQLEGTREQMILCLTSDTKVRCDVNRFNCKLFRASPLKPEKKVCGYLVFLFFIFVISYLHVQIRLTYQSWQFQPDEIVSQ